MNEKRNESDSKVKTMPPVDETGSVRTLEIPEVLQNLKVVTDQLEQRASQTKVRLLPALTDFWIKEEEAEKSRFSAPMAQELEAVTTRLIGIVRFLDALLDNLQL